MTPNYSSTLHDFNMTSLQAQTGLENTDRSPSAVDAKKSHVESGQGNLDGGEETIKTLSKIDGSAVTEAIVQLVRAVEVISSKLPQWRPPPSKCVFISLSTMCHYFFLFRIQIFKTGMEAQMLSIASAWAWIPRLEIVHLVVEDSLNTFKPSQLCIHV